MIVELTKDEAAMIRYALNEMAHRRREQAIDSGMGHINKEADRHLELAKRFKTGPDCLSQPRP